MFQFFRAIGRIIFFVIVAVLGIGVVGAVIAGIITLFTPAKTPEEIAAKAEAAKPMTDEERTKLTRKILSATKKPELSPSTPIDPGPGNYKSQEPQKPDLELLTKSGEYDDYSFKITGKIRNNTSKTYRYVQVMFKLFDSEGNQIGTALANIAGLDPNTTWKYEAFAAKPAARTYRLDGITGY
jgi:hypothetical protein